MIKLRATKNLTVITLDIKHYNNPSNLWKLIPTVWSMAADNWQLYTPLLLWTIGQEVGGGESGIRCPDLLLFTEWSVPGNCSLWRHLPSTSDLSTSSDFTFRFIRSSHVKSSVSPHAVLGKRASHYGHFIIFPFPQVPPDLLKIFYLFYSLHFLIELIKKIFWLERFSYLK